MEVCTLLIGVAYVHVSFYDFAARVHNSSTVPQFREYITTIQCGTTSGNYLCTGGSPIDVFLFFFNAGNFLLFLFLDEDKP